ncbi:MAG: hypothetical protein JWL84_3943 [Rhodospirillales bacterium]|jgi:hypothetical protein|nr:hypothetical protein [Rhodospirillales bacterium]
MGLKDFVKEGVQEIDQDSDPVLARRRAEEHARQVAEMERRDAEEKKRPKTPEMPGPSG